MRIFAAVTAFISLAITALAQPPVVRKAPDIVVSEPSGKKTPISSYKGKVVVVEFLYTTCPHCQKESQMLTKLYKEMAPRGLQIVGVAFNDNAAVLVPSFVQEFGVPYPIGASSPDAVMGYLGFSVMDRYVVPQVMVIDRKGNVRAQSPPQGDEKLQDETYVRNLLTSLLKEGAATSAVKAAPKTTASAH
jgi:peroxiredoxin